MILQSLVDYYEDLAAKGELPRPGWAMVKVSYALEIGEDGALLAVLPLMTQSADGKKLVPRQMLLPAPGKRTVGILPGFLCDNAAYMLGIDGKGNPERTLDCFNAMAQMHLELLGGSEIPFAKAVSNFFSTWKPETAAEHLMLQDAMAELLKGANLTFCFEGRFPDSEPGFAPIWQSHYDGAKEGDTMRCLVTGRQVVPELVHPAIKGIQNAQSSGAALVAFNAPAYWSYDREQSANAPMGKYAAFAYTTALNYLIATRNVLGRQRFCKYVGDTAILFWAQGGQEQYQDAFAQMYTGEGSELSQEDLGAFMETIAQGKPADWSGIPLDPSNHFYVLGLAPNAARLSVRFYLRDTFGNMLANILQHYEDLRIVKPEYEKFDGIPLWALLSETVNQKSRDKAPLPQMAGDTLRAILSGGRYPATLYQQTKLRIQAENNVTRGRAAIIKAYILRNVTDESIKEAAKVALNEQNNTPAYVLGRLFSLLENIQESASGATTVKDRFFSSACATPAAVFPQLLKLKNSHTKVLMREKPGLCITLEAQVADIISRLGDSFPKHLSLNEQGAFILGYYHQTQKRYEKKNA